MLCYLMKCLLHLTGIPLRKPMPWGLVMKGLHL
jgi:hypothetical protein